MSEVLPGAFVDEKSFVDFNTSFDTDDPLHEGGDGDGDDYIDSIEEISNYMNQTTCKEESESSAIVDEPQPPPLSSGVRLLTKTSDNGDLKATTSDKDKESQARRKDKYYAPVYVVRARVAGGSVGATANNNGEGKRRENRPPSTSPPPKEKRSPIKGDGPKSRDKQRQIAKREDQPVVEIRKREDDARDTMEQQRKLEAMRRAHEQEQQERERRLREKEKERQDKEKLQASRIPGERATLYDLMTVQFNSSATFEPNEVVLVPRTRGGYSYGRVVQHFLVDRCYADSSVAHTSYHWRMVYPNPGGGNMFKDLPPAYIGKLVTTLNKDLTMPKDEDGERIIGDKPLGKDLNNAVFAPTSKFNPNQIVLVPRSKGGFTYGRIVKECTFTCRIDESVKHEIAGWRVLVSGDDAQAQKVRKDVLAGNIGKLYIPEQLQAQMQAANEAASLPMPNVQPVSRRRISPESREGFQPPASLTTSASFPPAPALTSAPAQMNYAQALQITPPASASTPANLILSSVSTPSTPRALELPSAEDLENLANGRVSPNAESKKANEGDGSAAPLRGVIALPEGVLTKPHKDSRKHRNFDRSSHENSSENFNANSTSPTPASKLLVIDGPNVAMKHGNKKFSVKGIQIAVQYYKSKGYDVIAFVPEYFATRKAPQHQLGSSTLKLGDFMNSVAQDDMPLLNTMVDQGLIVLTPPQDYDDSYSIEYARKHNCCIVTNDRYNDNIEKQTTEREKAQTRKFIRDHSISFTFVRDEFMPNPDFKFPS